MKFKTQYEYMSNDQPLDITVVDKELPTCIDHSPVLYIPDLIKKMTRADISKVLGFDGYSDDMTDEELEDNVSILDDNKADVVDLFEKQIDIEDLLKSQKREPLGSAVPQAESPKGTKSASKEADPAEPDKNIDQGDLSEV